MSSTCSVHRKAFSALEKVDVDMLSELNEKEIRPILPCLVRMSLIQPLDKSYTWSAKRKGILRILSAIDLVNSIVALLSIDFHALEVDVKKEQQLRCNVLTMEDTCVTLYALVDMLLHYTPNQKQCRFWIKPLLLRHQFGEYYHLAHQLRDINVENYFAYFRMSPDRQKIGGHMSDSILVQCVEHGLGLEFERSDPARRLRLLLSELLSIISQAREQQDFVKPSELLDNEVYLEEVSDVLCIAVAELLALLSPQDVTEALLHVKNGPWLICSLVANIPDCYREVCTSLIINGEKQDEDSTIGQIRMQVLRMLSQMNPSESLAIRTKAVDQCRMPGLAVALTLDQCIRESPCSGDHPELIQDDLVAFITGLLLGNDCNVRIWFAHYVRNGQKKKMDSGTLTLHFLRGELLQRLHDILLFSTDHLKLPSTRVVQASALVRLYCALKGIAGFKLLENEINLLLQLLMSHPEPSPGGVRFVSLALCMLIACPSLIGSPDLERKGIDWLRWLAKEEAYFERTSGVKSSFGEILLLIAIHFHSNQLSAISDLVCSTLGMKIPIRPNNMARIKTIFTQDIFTEQVVTAHAVKVPVTPCLNANVQGFLPVHCIQQLLKSRAFSKHRVPIKDWIYRQVCNTIPPLHPVLPSLLEAYVNSIILPSMKGATVGDTTNEPIAETEILALFKQSIFTVHLEEPRDGRCADYINEESYRCSSGQPTPVQQELQGLDKHLDQSTKLASSMTAQLLLLYYLLQYEDVRMGNTRAVVTACRKVKCYSQNFLAALPIKYLLQEAQKEQHSYAGLFSPLLRLLATHHPHLCLVEDWLFDDIHSADQWNLLHSPLTIQCSTTTVRKAFVGLQSSPIQAVVLLRHLMTLSARELWPFAYCIICQFPLLLEPGIPRHVHELFRQIWLKLNTIFPGRLWVMTVNALRPHDVSCIKDRLLSQDDITVDPLSVLRSDARVFRCGQLLEIVLHILRAFLAASRIHLARHLLDNPVLPPEKKPNGHMASLAEREELKNALLLSQESAAVQMLMEVCLPSNTVFVNNGLMSNLREVQTLVCSNLHQIFIADPHLVKLVQFQGYPLELIPVTVPGIPSMHIFLDFAPELMGQPQLIKQGFAMELTSFLCLQYAVPKSFGVARLVINTLSTLLGVLPCSLRQHFFIPTLPAVVRICQAFPPLREDAISFLLQLSHVCMSHSSLIFSGQALPPMDILGNHVRTPIAIDLALRWADKHEKPKSLQLQNTMKKIVYYPLQESLAQKVKEAFEAICDIAIFNNSIY